MQGHAIVYCSVQCAIVHALSCQCKEVHSRAEMPEACSLCWLAEAVTPYFPLSSTKFCNSDPPSAMPVKYMLVKPLAVHIISQLLNWQYTAVTFFPFLGVSNSLTLQFVMIFLAEGQWPFFAFMKFLTSPAFMNECNQRRLCHQTYMFWVNFSGEYVSAGGMGSMDSDGTKNVRNFNISPLRCTRNPSIDSNTNMKL